MNRIAAGVHRVIESIFTNDEMLSVVKDEPADNPSEGVLLSDPKQPTVASNVIVQKASEVPMSHSGSSTTTEKSSAVDLPVAKVTSLPDVESPVAKVVTLVDASPSARVKDVSTQTGVKNQSVHSFCECVALLIVVISG